MRKPLQVFFYTRPGCHLCDDTAGELRSLARRFALMINEVDITVDREAYDRWWADIPVVVIGDKVLRAPIDRLHLQRTILDSMRHPL